MLTHELKCLAGYFEELWMGTKTFEIRRNDRGFEVGDTLVLRETRSHASDIHEHYTGREMEVRVTYITNFPDALQPGYVVLAVKEIRRRIGTGKWFTKVAQICSLLEQSAGICMDNDKERLKLAKRLAKEL